MSEYLNTAKAIMRFIDSRKQNGPEGIYWSLQDAAQGRDIYYDEISMYAGASGIICFLLSLYDITREEEYLKEAEKAADYIIYRWNNDRKLKRNFSVYAFSSGWSGAGFALTNLYNITRTEKYKETVLDITRAIKADGLRPEDGKGYYWSTFPGIVGNAGTILFLLYAAENFCSKEIKEYAIEAGRYYLGRGRKMGDGKLYYSGIDPVYFKADENYVDPNYPMGTAGIGFLLLKLYEASGNEDFFHAVKGIPEYMDTVAVKIGNKGKLLPHGLPDRGNLFYLGYCHGPAGTTRFYYKLYEMTGDKKYLKAIRALVDGLIETGAPETRTKGYWNVYNMCCGTAGLLNMFMGLWAAGGRDEDYQLAKRCGQEILSGITLEDDKAKIPFALDRIAPDVITTPIGLFDGAAGVGAALLQLYTAEQNDFHVSRLLDDPFPEKIIFRKG